MTETTSQGTTAPPAKYGYNPDGPRRCEPWIAETVRAVAITEGISLLLLFFVAMPVKYQLGNPILVKWIGPIHGALFVLYVAALVMWRSNLNWSWGRVALATLLASFPLATFFPQLHAPRDGAAKRG